MDPFHERLAQVALHAGVRHGFCLAGGYAVQAHGFVNRLSKDVDLFTTEASVVDFPAAQSDIMAALRADGLDVAVDRDGPTFARLAVTDPANGQAGTIELGVDWRAYPPVQMRVGPVLHPDDAVANKLCALYGRAETRDYIDVDGVLADGRYSGDQLLRLAVNHDPGFDKALFSDALRAVRRFPQSAFDLYGLSPDQVEGLQARLLAWADEINSK
jgi:hypothetical protein